MPTKSIGKYITHIYRNLQTYINKELSEYNITNTQFLFFLNIYYHPGINQEELSNLLSIDKITTSKAIKKLVDEGYVYKLQDQQDKRCYKLYLTQIGNATYPIVRKVLDNTMEIFSKDFSDEEISILLNFLDRLEHNIQNRQGNEYRK